MLVERVDRMDTHIQVLLSPGSRHRSQNNILGGVSSTHCPRSPIKEYFFSWFEPRHITVSKILQRFTPPPDLCLEWALCRCQPEHPVCCPGLVRPLCFHWHETDSGSEHWPRPASHWYRNRKIKITKFQQQWKNDHQWKSGLYDFYSTSS